MKKGDKSDITFLAAGILLTGSIFTLDLFLPLGAADGMLYLVVMMLLASSASGKRFMVPLAAACSILTIVGTFYSPPGGVLVAGIINRFLTLFAVWGVTILSLQKRLTEENQSSSEERFREWSDAAFDGVAVHEQGRILQANQSLARIFGYELGGNERHGDPESDRAGFPRHSIRKPRLGCEDTLPGSGVEKKRNDFLDCDLQPGQTRNG